jgi:predicted glycoside hydrolase/deacetylase ChbG (UPF0249 family)
MTTPVRSPAYLIVNADDYGYFGCVSRGILQAATEGIVTATGVFANATHFDEHAAWLRDCEHLDVGVHLNLTDGTPLTDGLRRKLSRWSGQFPRKFPVATAVLSGAIAPADVKAEWQAQIERCLAAGLPVRFLNSHEHVHLLPSLFRIVTSLASDYGIAHVRFPTSQLAVGSRKGLQLRSIIVKALNILNRSRVAMPPARFLGLECSGKLDLSCLENCIAEAGAGQVCELMCHPGQFDAQEVRDPRLLAYHDWEGELRTLTSSAAREMLDHHGIHLVGYRDLQIVEGRLGIRDGGGRH